MRDSKLGPPVAMIAGVTFLVSALGAVTLAGLAHGGQPAFGALQGALQFAASAALLTFGAAITDWKPQERSASRFEEIER